MACASRVGHTSEPDQAEIPVSTRGSGRLAAGIAPEYDAALDLTMLQCADRPVDAWLGLMLRADTIDGSHDFTVKRVDRESWMLAVRGDASLIAPGSDFLIVDYRPFVVESGSAIAQGPESSATVAQLQQQLDEQLTWFGEYRLDYEDSFHIRVLGHDEWSTRVTVLRDGNIYFGYFRSDKKDDDDHDGLQDPDDPPSDPPPSDPPPTDPGVQPPPVDPGPGPGPGPDPQPLPDPDTRPDPQPVPGAPRTGRPMRVVGLTLSQAQEMIVESLREYFYDPQVKIEEITQSPTSYTVKVLGAVNRPGRVKIQAGFRLLDALADAGGEITRTTLLPVGDDTPLLPTVDWVNSRILREARFLPAGTAPAGVRPTDLCRLRVQFELLSGDAQQNIPLFPGDVVQITPYEAKNTRVIVAGRVNVPGVFYYRDRIDLVEALARAGWMTEDVAKVSGVYLVRNSIAPDDQRELYILNPINVARGTARNVPLRDGDILYVDSTSLHDIQRVMGQISTIFSPFVSSSTAANNYRNLFR
ncbi:MAG: SLBB domain-containing protein [Planctomycetota bacterium]